MILSHSKEVCYRMHLALPAYDQGPPDNCARKSALKDNQRHSLRFLLWKNYGWSKAKLEVPSHISHTNNLQQVIEPVRSRCLCVRIAAPTEDEICKMISYVADEEGIKVPDELKFRLAKVTCCCLKM